MGSTLAWVPDPTIIVTVGSSFIGLLTYQVLRKSADRISDNIAEDLSKLYSSIKAVASGMAKYANPKTRPITYLVHVPGNPNISFVARTTEVNLLLNALLKDRSQEALQFSEELHTVINAVEVQFLLNANGHWEFNYLLTENGGVVGTPESFSRRARRLELSPPGAMSLGGDPIEHELSIDSSNNEQTV